MLLILTILGVLAVIWAVSWGWARLLRRVDDVRIQELIDANRATLRPGMEHYDDAHFRLERKGE